MQGALPPVENSLFVLQYLSFPISGKWAETNCKYSTFFNTYFNFCNYSVHKVVSAQKS